MSKRNSHNLAAPPGLPGKAEPSMTAPESRESSSEVPLAHERRGRSLVRTHSTLPHRGVPEGAVPPAPVLTVTPATPSTSPTIPTATVIDRSKLTVPGPVRRRSQSTKPQIKYIGDIVNIARFFGITPETLSNPSARFIGPSRRKRSETLDTWKTAIQQYNTMHVENSPYDLALQYAAAHQHLHNLITNVSSPPTPEQRSDLQRAIHCIQLHEASMKGLKCLTCGTVSITKKDFQIHADQHLEIGLIDTCKLCDVKMPDAMIRRLHTMTQDHINKLNALNN